MSNRVKENAETRSIIVNNMIKMGTSEELTCWNLGTISTLLNDISISLAVIADRLESESLHEADSLNKE